jgi:phospholipid transport system substrate-binding protein
MKKYSNASCHNLIAVYIPFANSAVKPRNNGVFYNSSILKTIILTVLSITLAFAFTTALAADPPPLIMMKNISDNTLSALKKNKSSLNNRQVIHKIVNQEVVPYFDMETVARSVVGRNYWEQATAQQKNEFIRAFQYYVTDMYSTALASYNNEAVVFPPLRNYDPEQNRIQIYSNLQRSGASPINLNYRLVKYNTWKIYDFSVDGISMIQSYRSQFTPILQKGGLSELTKQLKNRTLNAN